MFLAFNLVSTVHVLAFFAVYSRESLADIAFPCGRFEEYRVCGPKCPVTCDTLNTNVCCDVTCVAGCFCRDGYMLVKADGPRRCVPISNCPKPGVLEFKDRTLAVIESQRVVEIVVLRLNGSYGEISVSWRTVEFTARNFVDFAPSNGVLVFPDGVTSRVIRVAITDDDVREADEYFSVVISDPTNKAEISPRRLEGIRIVIKDDDMKPGYIELEQDKFTIKEDYGTLRVNVLRIGGTDGILRIKYKTVDTKAVTNLDYVPVQGDLVFNDGESKKSLDIVILNDNLRESLESFELQIYDITPGDGTINFRSLGTKLTAVIEITDDDMRPGYLEFERENITIKENYGTLRVNVVRVGGTDGVLRMKYRTVDLAAIVQTDYSLALGELVFNEGESRKSIDVAILNDNLKESAEAFQLQIYDVSSEFGSVDFRTMGTRLTTLITILDDDTKPGYLEFEQDSFTISEDSGTLQVTVIRVGGTDGVLRMRYRTVDSSAVVQRDYAPLLGELVFNEGEIRKTIDIAVVNDNIKQTLKTFQLEMFDLTSDLGSIDFRSMRSRMATKITIIDDDTKPGYLEFEQDGLTVREDSGTLQVTVVRVGGTDGVLRMKYRTVDSSAVVQRDYAPLLGELVFNAGEVRKTIDIAVVNDNIKQSLKTFQLEMYDVTSELGSVDFRSMRSRMTTKVTIIDDETKPGYLEFEQDSFTVREDSGTLQVTVIRVGGTDGVLRMRYRTVDSSAVVQRDYAPLLGQLVFNAGEIRKTIDIVVVNDNIKQSLKTFQLEMYDITSELGSVDFRSMRSRITATVTIIDDETKPGYLEFERDTFTIREDTGTLRVTVIRVGGTDGTLRMRYRTIDIAAVVQRDYAPVPGELVFNDGESRKTIDIVILNDNVKESLKTFQLQIVDISSEFGSVDFRSMRSRMTTLISIIDDDMRPGYVEFEQGNFTVREDTGTVQVTVIRVGGTDGVLRMRYRTIDIAAVVQRDYLPLQGVLVFDDGESRKTIDITIINNNAKDTLKSFQLQIVDLSSDFGNIDFRSMRSRMFTQINIIDDDMRPGYLEFEKGNFTVREDSGTLQVVVVRVGGTDGVLRMRYRTIDIAAVVQKDYAPLQGELVFNDGESRKTIDIKILNDNVKETLKSFQLQIVDISSEYGSIDFRSMRSRMTTLINIIDDDISPGYLELSNPVVTIPESVGSITINVFRRGGQDGEIRVRYRTVDGSATAPSDYQSRRGELVFADGVTVQPVTIVIVNDEVTEPTESFRLELFDATVSPDLLYNFRSMSARISTIVTILDDDNPSIIRFRRRSGDIGRGSSLVEIPVIRENRLDRRVSVYWRIEAVSPSVLRSPASAGSLLTFEPGEDIKVLRITLQMDGQFDRSDLLEVILFDPSEGAVLGVPSRYTVQLLDYQKPAPQVSTQASLSSSLQISFPQRQIRVREDVGTIRISISRRGDMAPFVVRIRTVDGSATAGKDFRRVSGPLTFKRGDVEVVIAIRIIDDQEVEPDESFTLELLEPSLGVIPRGLGIVTVTITDNDGEVDGRRDSYAVTQAQPRPPSGGHAVGLLTKCPDHLIMKVCADSCPPSCNSINGKVPCNLNGGCIRACFCPEGFVKESESSERCIRPSECPGGYSPPLPPASVQRSKSHGLLGGYL